MSNFNTFNPHTIRCDLSLNKETEIIKWYDEKGEEKIIKNFKTQNIEDLEER